LYCKFAIMPRPAVAWCELNWMLHQDGKV
jgi:hypothetical protein